MKIKARRKKNNKLRQT